MDLDNVIQEKLDADTAFAAELEALPEADRAQVIADKRAELTRQEFANLEEAKVKAEQIAADQKGRAERAEAAKKEAKPAEGATPLNENYSLSDTKALLDVHDEDVSELVKWAKFNNVSVAEAKKSPVMQTYLKNKAEERTSAQVANTGGGRRGISKNTDADILAKAEAGQLPEDDEGIKRLSEARLNARIAATNNKS